MTAKKFIHFAGIDYGAKLSGNTVIAFATDQLNLLRVAKGKDADAWLMDIITEKGFKQVFIDAPLSLPLAYSQKLAEPDFFYRACDRELKAMSPLFLGGLTARAIRLKHLLEKEGAELYETYPAAIQKEVLASPHYQQKGKEALIAFAGELEKAGFSHPIPTIQNWHQADALLAWLGGYRYNKGMAKVYGRADEGLAYV